MTYSQLTIGTPFFDRKDKLYNLLDSTPESVNTVIIANNGPEELDQSELESKFGVEINILELEYDCGIGKCRFEISNELDTDYLLMIDSDMLIPHNVDLLMDILAANDELGGVAGLLYEHGRIRAGACDFKEIDGYLLQTGRNLETSMKDGIALIYAAKITQNFVLRKEVLDTYTWDPDAGSKEHIDFFLKHWQEGKWTWAVCPSVVFRHDTGGSSGYQTHRTSNTEESHEYIKEKYGYRIVSNGITEPLDTLDRSLVERIGKAGHKYLPNKVWIPIKERVNALK